MLRKKVWINYAFTSKKRNIWIITTSIVIDNKHPKTGNENYSFKYNKPTIFKIYDPCGRIGPTV